LAGAWLSLILAELHAAQVDILPKKLLFLSGLAVCLDNLEMRLNSAQLELELG